ncbi:hypothetical protein [Falsiroseomonas sp. CW058]|uniref:hypothetical protein n=1 Tax=Falsiroseomonas sp. CW058 TaxID=3388664 RepID=UPI003D31B8A2
MDTQRRPPVLDMTPDGEFLEPPGARGGPQAKPASALDRALARIGGVALLVALVAGGLVLAGVALLFVGLVLPVLVVAGLVGAGSLWWRLRRARKQGGLRFVVIRR